MLLGVAGLLSFVEGTVGVAVFAVLAAAGGVALLYSLVWMRDPADRPRTTTLRNSPLNIQRGRLTSTADDLAVESPIDGDELEIDHKPGGDT